MTLQIGVKVLIKNKQGEYLFLRRTALVSTDTTETSWDIPGGRIDPTEPLADALKREVHEEVGHSLQSTPQLIAAQDIFVPAKDLHVVRLTYVAEEDAPSITLSDEHESHRWVRQSEVDSINVEPYLAEVLRRLR